MFRIVFVGLLSVAALGSAPGRPASAFTEAEFLAALQPDHPAIRETAEAVELARARLLSARLLPNPEFGFEHEDPEGPSGQSSWTVAWQLPELDRTSQIAAARSSATAAEHQRTHQLHLVRLSMREAYAEWAVAFERWRLLSQRVAAGEALLQRETHRFEGGETSGLQVRRLELMVSTLRVQVAQADALRAAARGRAEVWADLPAGATPVLPDATAVHDRIGEHPLILSARADLEAASFEREAAGVVLGSPEIQVGWQRQQMETFSPEGPLFSISWSVPLWSRKQGERASATAHVDAAQARLATLQRQVHAHFGAAEAAWHRLSSAYSEAEANAAENARLLAGAEAAFQLGEATLTDYLDTARAVTESELSLLELHSALLAAERELVRLGASVSDVPFSN